VWPLEEHDSNRGDGECRRRTEVGDVDAAVRVGKRGEQTPEGEER
jgi:hypothetical protein